MRLGNIYKNHIDAEQIKARYQALVERYAEQTMAPLEFLSLFVEDVLQSKKPIVLIDVTSPQIRGLLEAFPDSKVLHLIRYPFNIINSEYRFRFSNAESFGGGFPGSWEFSQSFDRVFHSFQQAKEFSDHPQVKIIKLEDMQESHETVLSEALGFLGVGFEPVNQSQTQSGIDYDGNSTYDRKKNVFTQPNDWSCLSQNDLFYGSKIEDAKGFYDIPDIAWQKNSYFKFLKRQLGYTGKNRKKVRSIKMLLKVCVLSISQYLQDIRAKNYLQHKLNIPPFDDFPAL